jgi:hypothetical protein
MNPELQPSNQPNYPEVIGINELLNAHFGAQDGMTAEEPDFASLVVADIVSDLMETQPKDTDINADVSPVAGASAAEANRPNLRRFTTIYDAIALRAIQEGRLPSQGIRVEAAEEQRDRMTHATGSVVMLLTQEYRLGKFSFSNIHYLLRSQFSDERDSDQVTTAMTEVVLSLCNGRLNLSKELEAEGLQSTLEYEEGDGETMQTIRYLEGLLGIPSPDKEDIPSSIEDI